MQPTHKNADPQDAHPYPFAHPDGNVDCANRDSFEYSSGARHRHTDFTRGYPNANSAASNGHFTLAHQITPWKHRNPGY